MALFAGAGGGILGGVLLGWRTVCAVELDPYCRGLLRQKQDEGLLAPFAIWDDIKTFDGRPWRGRVDVVSAGFPCQPFSVAGEGQAEDDTRNLWPETIRVIRQVGPEWLLLENVPGLLAHGYFGTILRDLSDAGFDAEWDVIGASELGASHQRRRLWIVAHAASKRLPGPGNDPRHARDHEAHPRWETTDALNALAKGAVPVVCGEDDGLPSSLDRLRALGNAQVPLCAATAFRRLAPLLQGDA